MSVQTGSALTVVDNPEGGEGAHRDEEDEATVDEDGDLEDIEVVQPTEQWQTLKPGDVLTLCLNVLQCVGTFHFVAIIAFALSSLL